MKILSLITRTSCRSKHKLSNQHCYSVENMYMLNVNNCWLRSGVLSKMVEDSISGRRIVKFAQKVSLLLCKIAVESLMSHGLFYRCPYYVSGPWTCPLRCCLWRVRDFSDSNKNILICVPKMNEDLTGLEWHEGE